MPRAQRAAGLLAGIAFALAAGLAQAAGPASPPLVRTERLASLIPEPGPIDLRGDRGEFSLYFNVSTRIDPATATLHLELSNSQALLAPRSQLVIRLNDAVVAQIGLRPNVPLTVADIDLPVALLRGGSNRMSFAAAQHYTNECENPAAAELWSQIDTTRSRLTIAGRGVEVAPVLSQLPDLIGPGFFGGRRFTLLSPPSGSPATPPSDPAHIATGATLAQAVALRLRYQAPEIGYAVATPAPAASPAASDPMLRLALPSGGFGTDPGDLILFGTKSELAPVLGPALAAAIGPGGFIGVQSLAIDRQRLVLIVSGTTEDEVQRAATALGVANFPFVDAAQQTVDQLDVRPGQSFYSRNELLDGTRTSFADLGFKSATLRGVAASTGLEISVPADYYTPDSAEAELWLNFAYGAGLRADSVVNLMLNGQFLQSLALSDAGGAVLRNYRMKLPARKLRPGRNTIAFDTVMIPSVAGACTAPQTRNLIFALDDTSSINLPHGERLASLPDLRLFSATGYPYVGSPGFDVALAATDPATIAAGWTILARLAQLAGRTLPEGRVVLGTPATGRDVLLVGASPDLQPALLAAYPSGLQPEMVLPYASAVPPRTEPASWTRSLLDLFGIAARAETATEPPGTRIVGHGALGQNGLLAAARAPTPGEHTLTMLTAATPEALWMSAQQMVQPAVWFQLADNVTVWRAGSDTVNSERVGTMYHVGSRNTLYAARYFVAEYPLAWIAMVLGSVLLLAVVLRLALVRRRRRLFPGSVEGVP